MNYQVILDKIFELKENHQQIFNSQSYDTFEQKVRANENLILIQLCPDVISTYRLKDNPKIVSNYLKPLEESVELIKLDRNIERRNIMAVNF